DLLASPTMRGEEDNAQCQSSLVSRRHCGLRALPSRMRIGKAVAFGECGEDCVLVGNERATTMAAGLVRRGRSNRQHEQWQRLVLLADQRDYRLPWARPRDALDVELLGELWKRDQHAFDQRAVPAIEMAARKGRIPEP